jgi:hypothetical protein
MRLPPPPPLKTGRRPLLVFGYLLEQGVLLNWATDHQLSNSLRYAERLDVAFNSIFIELAVARKGVEAGIAMKTINQGLTSIPVSCLTIGSNESRSRLEDAYDGNMIRLCMKVLGTKELPRWRRAGEA